MEWFDCVANLDDNKEMCSHLLELKAAFLQLFRSSSMFLSVSMSSPCLSSILTNANLTMYQTGIPDVQPSVLPSINTLQISNSAYNSNMSGKRNISVLSLLCLCDAKEIKIL